MDVTLKVNEAADEALSNAMYRFTFGIIGDGRGGAQGRSLGTGVGVRWKNTYLILTAAHTVQETPYGRVYFLPPEEALHLADSEISTGPKIVTIRKRFELEKPRAILSDYEDLAAFVLEEQEQEEGKTHFYHLDEIHSTPHSPIQIGVLGYPGATTLPIGANFMATPYSTFGELCDDSDDNKSCISVSYPKAQTVDAHGLSGSGFWISKDTGGIVWNPTVALVGLVTHYDRASEVLVGYRVEKLVDFLKSKQESLVE